MKRILFIKLFFILFISYLYCRYPDVVANNGIVVSSNKYASQVGIDILKKGGNAIDAAIATGFALAVVHPGAGNIGGGGFMLIRLADGTVTAIDFRETAPIKAYKDMFLDEFSNIIKNKSWSSSWATGVPGSVAGFGYAHEKYGSIDWRTLVYPSSNLAIKGYDLDIVNVSYLNSPYYNNFLSNDSETKNIFTKSNGDMYYLGEKFIQRNLGLTLKRIARKGYQEFYQGETAKKIINCMERTEGLITSDDLENYNVKERDPIVFDYRGFKIYSMPPASSGGIAIAGILNQLERIDLSEIKYHSAQHIHYVTEAERRVYADRAEFLGDIDFVDVPIEQLTSDEYAKKRWESVDSLKATLSLELSHGNIDIDYNEPEQTTHYSVIDKWGNAVSVTTTINGWYGNGIMVDGAGFLLNNEMDDFSSKPGVPNAYGLIGNLANSIHPNKRMLSSMSPTIVENQEGELFLILGSPGGSTIITTVAQIIMNVIDFDMNVQEAVESPRFHHQWLPDIIQFESAGFSTETIHALVERGHKYKFRGSIGEANCIELNNNLFFGTGDSRRGAYALGY